MKTFNLVIKWGMCKRSIDHFPSDGFYCYLSL